MKLFLLLPAIITLFVASCTKESNNTPSAYVLNTFEKGKIYNIKKEVIRLSPDSIRVFNYDSTGNIDYVFIAFSDSGMSCFNSYQLLGGMNPVWYSSYHVTGNKISVDEYHSGLIATGTWLFEATISANDTVLTSTDGVHELHLRKKP